MAAKLGKFGDYGKLSLNFGKTQISSPIDPWALQTPNELILISYLCLNQIGDDSG